MAAVVLDGHGDGAAAGAATLFGGTLAGGKGTAAATGTGAVRTAIDLRGAGAAAVGGMANPGGNASLAATAWRLNFTASVLSPIGSLPLTHHREWQDQLSEPGAGSLIFQNDDPSLALMGGDGWDLVLFTLNGLASSRNAWMLLCEEFDRASIAPGEGLDEQTKWTGRGHLALLQRGVVYPTNGVGRLPIEEDRAFNWTSLDYNYSGYELATVVTTIGTAKTSWANTSPGWDADYPDDTASILWDNDGTTTEAIPGTVYGWQLVTIGATGDYTLYSGADNYGEMYVDGQLIGSPGQGSGGFGNGFLVTVQGTVRLSAGDHLFAWRCVNFPFSEGNVTVSESGNPAGFVWSLYSFDAAGGLGTLTANSNGTARILRSETTPGMTPGEVMNICLDEWEARGGLVFSRQWTDERDSDGTSWSVTADIATKVNTDILTFFREMSATYIDFWLEPGTLRLFAWIKDSRGATRSVSLYEATSLTDAFSGNLVSLNEKGEVPAMTAGLVRWNGGWAERQDDTLITSYGRVEAALGLGALGSLDEAYRVADEQLSEFGNPREEITVETLPLGDADTGYLGFDVGDTITVPDAAGSPTSERVVAFTVAEDQDTGRVIVTPTLKNVLIDGTSRTFQALKKMTNGTLQGRSKAAQPVVPQFVPRGFPLASIPEREFPAYQADGGTSFNNALQATMTGTWPIHQAGDIGLFIASSLTGSDPHTLNTPNGFALLASSQVSGTGHITVFWCRATSSSMANPIVNSPTTTIVDFFTIRNCVSTGNPWDTYAASSKTAASTTLSIAPLTVGANNSLIVYFATVASPTPGATEYSNEANAALTGVAERQDTGVPGPPGWGLMGAWSGALTGIGSSGTLTADIGYSTAEAYLAIAFIGEAL